MQISNNAAVLVVDDNLEIISLLCRVVENLGYIAIAARNAQFAIEAMCQQPTHIWCAILDIQLPGINGIFIAQQLRQVAPELPIIFITGYPLLLFQGQITQFHSALVIQKPFDIKVLHEALQHSAAYIEYQA